jgi:hypothetical protein
VDLVLLSPAEKERREWDGGGEKKISDDSLDWMKRRRVD